MKCFCDTWDRYTHCSHDWCTTFKHFAIHNLQTHLSLNKMVARLQKKWNAFPQEKCFVFEIKFLMIQLWKSALHEFIIGYNNWPFCCVTGLNAFKNTIKGGVFSEYRLRDRTQSCNPLCEVWSHLHGTLFTVANNPVSKSRLVCNLSPFFPTYLHMQS